MEGHVAEVEFGNLEVGVNYRGSGFHISLQLCAIVYRFLSKSFIMLRFRSLAVACVRDTLRPNNAGRGTILGVAARPLICHFSESSPVLTAPQGAPLPASPPFVHINGHSSETARSGAVSHEQNQCVQKKEADGHDGLDIRNVERQQSANTEVGITSALDAH